MRLLIDLQALQSHGSRDRGIGRYARALTRSIIMQGAEHDINVVLNNSFPDTIQKVISEFQDILPREAFHVFDIPTPINQSFLRNKWRTHVAEAIYKNFIRQLKPDVFHISSLFEGHVDNCVNFSPADESYVTAITLYDLIPFLKQDIYLTDSSIRKWYYRKIESLTHADLLLAISDASRMEAIKALNFDRHKVVAISTDSDALFRKCDISDIQEVEIRRRLHLNRPYVMYTGGIDPRKNISGLIKAFAQIPKDIRQRFQLAIVCRALPSEQSHLMRLAKEAGLKEGDVVLTGYVSDEDMVILYNLCELFVFPSVHEGFGLPVLEAMRCGAPVIGSNLTSIPEIIVDPDALFCPHAEDELSSKIIKALLDEPFRQRLRENGRKQEQRFSWKESGKRALDAFVKAHKEKKIQPVPPSLYAGKKKPRLAYISPIKPQKSGIADYSCDLIPYLQTYYEIDIVSTIAQTSDKKIDGTCNLLSIKEFERQSHRFDRILYHIGNSEFHAHMPSLLEKYPGTVVQHDLYLSGLFHYMEAKDPGGFAFQQNLYRSHGYEALELFNEKGALEALWRYPCNKDVMTHAIGIIFHSLYSIGEAKKFYQLSHDYPLVHIRHMRKLLDSEPKEVIRKKILMPDAGFVLSSFGMLDSTKLNDVLLDAWLESSLSSCEDCYLFFVGDAPGTYGAALHDKIKNAGKKGERVRILGYVEEATYHDYLIASDVAVQLREKSRGETSGAIADCLGCGLPVIMNNHGTNIEIPGDICFKISEAFSIQELVDAIEGLYKSSHLREELGKKAKEYVREKLDPAQIADLYRQAIEEFADTHPLALEARLLEDISNIIADEKTDISDEDLAQISSAIAHNDTHLQIPRLLIDVTDLIHTGEVLMRERLAAFLSTPQTPSRVEPVYFDGKYYRYARSFTTQFLNIKNPSLKDAILDRRNNDVWISREYLASADLPVSKNL